MSDLRETLALRLRHVTYANGFGVNPAGSVDEFGRILADECIRQMEWAREATLVSVSEPGRDWAENRREHPDRYPALTTAPPDWRPK
jgi:hypothetical protein